VLEKEGAELEVGAEVFECGGGGDELEVAGGNKGDLGVVLEDGPIVGGGIAEAEDGDADLGALEGFVLEDGLDVGLEIGAGGGTKPGDAGDYDEEGEQAAVGGAFHHP